MAVYKLDIQPLTQDAGSFYDAIFSRPAESIQNEIADFVRDFDPRIGKDAQLQRAIQQARDAPPKLATGLKGLTEHLPTVEATARSATTVLEQLYEEMKYNKEIRSARDPYAHARATFSAALAAKRKQFDRELRRKHDHVEERYLKLEYEATLQNIVGKVIQ